MTIKSWKKLRNPKVFEQFVSEWVANNKASFDQHPVALLRMLILQATTDINYYLVQSHDENTLQGAHMSAVLLEKFLVLKTIDHVLADQEERAKKVMEKAKKKMDAAKKKAERSTKNTKSTK